MPEAGGNHKCNFLYLVGRTVAHPELSSESVTLRRSAAMAVSVAELCKQRQLSAPMLAEAAGLDVARVEAIVAGRWTPSPVERERIASVFGSSPQDIAWGHTVPIQHLYGHGPG
jgi:hypothetical protein